MAASGRDIVRYEIQEKKAVIVNPEPSTLGLGAQGSVFRVLGWRAWRLRMYSMSSELKTFRGGRVPVYLWIQDYWDPEHINASPQAAVLRYCHVGYHFPAVIAMITLFGVAAVPTVLPALCCCFHQCRKGG